MREIEKHHKLGQPILVGTGSVEDSEHLSKKLHSCNIPHEVLNAKNNSREAEIIKLAGQLKSVTISTNMAGRGTDIKLGSGVAEIGGLYVIGTERHESRRIDLQLRGRSGRQGDPGMSRFFISLSDPLFKRFAQERIQKAISKLQNDYFDSRFFSRMLQNTQKKIESINFDIRKNLIDYDHILSNQRELIYKQRDHILKSSKFDNIIQRMLTTGLNSIFETNNARISFGLNTMHNLINAIKTNFLVEFTVADDVIKNMGYNEFFNYVQTIIQEKLKEKILQFPKEIVGNILRDILIRSIDKF